MISFLPTQCMIFPIRFVMQSAKDFHSCKCKPIRKAATSTKSKAAGIPPIPLDVYFFCQRRRHDCRRAFSLPEFVRRIAPPASSLFGKLLHLTQNKSGRDSPESVHRIAPPVQTILTLQTHPESCCISCKTKAAGLPPIPLDVYFFPTQTARLPHGVFSTRICASNRSANADT